MKALSLWQPWASLMASGHKAIETRPAWAMRMLPLVGSDLAICSTRTTPAQEFGGAMLVRELREAALEAHPEVDPAELVTRPTLWPSGAVLALVRVADVVPMRSASLPIADGPPRYCAVSDHVLAVTDHVGALSAVSVNIEAERPFGFYEPGRVAIITDNLRRLPEPVPVTGHQQVWNLPIEVEAEVRAALGMAEPDTSGRLW